MTVRPISIDVVLADLIEALPITAIGVDTFNGAACVGVDPDLFFSDIKAEIIAAKEVCFSCPIRVSCLEGALARGDYGVWGGTTDQQRAQMRDRGAKLPLPGKDQVAAELNRILYTDPVEVAREFQVNDRTVTRWRAVIRSNPGALRIANSLV